MLWRDLNVTFTVMIAGTVGLFVAVVGVAGPLVVIAAAGELVAFGRGPAVKNYLL